ncbi:hypothetical protein GA0115240_15423 [Streptomyces sp. DvalAA-14]|uniref:hypothetical protein n=1 Tax=unclassified Streptomyces TaxID=2593676 RepID=UPI00081B797C|nr:MULTISPECIES: hypothetical protein [unclassified Streptomyces]MYS23599.1 hypothetical protein [Streptomyces sp. SID4948]SCE36008.1 hypothetical protein GA0115240_15423 [Streptomyces sp. DvalAA-14]
MRPVSRGWQAVAELRAAEVLHAMGTSGFTELHDQMVLFFRALALEVGDSVKSGKAPPGLPMEIDDVIWYSVAVPWEGVFFSYSVYPGERQIRICDLIWITTDPDLP